MLSMLPNTSHPPGTPSRCPSHSLASPPVLPRLGGSNVSICADDCLGVGFLTAAGGSLGRCVHHVSIFKADWCWCIMNYDHRCTGPLLQLLQGFLSQYSHH